ncbi:MAG: hypothetical protein WCK46_01555 [Candidatus Adlerbacteria bacterium]
MRLGRNKKIIAVATLALLCVGVAGALWFWTHPVLPQNKDGGVRITHWKERIETESAKDAYTELACSLKNKTGVQGHTEAHYFGAALYQEVGLAGAFTCDDRFQYGCLHELLGRALHAQGVSVLPALHAICAQSEATNVQSLCEHGIGHGILSYAGYNPQALTSALSLCKNSSAASAAGKCEAGVFMEYFDQTMLGADTPPFKISKDSPFAPCSGFAASEHAQCVSFMPRVWRKNFWPTSATSTEAVATTGAYCESLPEHFLQVSCFAGIGNELYIQTHGNTSAATLLCTHYSNDTSLVASCTKEIAHLANIDARAIHTDACTQ